LAGVVGAAAALTGGWIAYSRTRIDHALPLPPAIDAERSTFETVSAGQLSYYADRSGSGRPVVLIHSINAAASAYEMKPIFERLRGQRPVFALDLPGFGFSERSDRDYSPQLYEMAIYQLLENHVGQPADVVALSLGSEFAARAAYFQPGRFHSLAVISPSGFSHRSQADPEEQIDRRETQEKALSALSAPLWKQALYDLIATRLSIRYFLQKSFEGPVPNEMVEYAYLSAHQPGAEYAPLYFLSGLLFTPDVRRQFYARLQAPALLLYDRDPYVMFEQLGQHLEENPNWRAVRIAPTRGLPHFELLDETMQALEDFWRSLEPFVN
jgi:pimeloyl-ACP methyl ester carboxylesterase